MRVLTIIAFVAILASCSQDAVTSSAQELTSRLLTERMLEDPIVSESLNSYVEWQRLEAEGIRTANGPLGENQYNEMKLEPSKALDFYSGAGYENALLLAQEFQKWNVAATELLSKYQDELMRLPLDERQKVLDALEILKN